MIIDKNYTLNADDDDESFCLKNKKKKLRFSVCVNRDEKNSSFKIKFWHLHSDISERGVRRKKLSEIKKNFFPKLKQKKSRVASGHLSNNRKKRKTLLLF